MRRRLNKAPNVGVAVEFWWIVDGIGFCLRGLDEVLFG